MFKHILSPTDGSRLSDRAVARAITLAKELGARLTLINVVPEFQMIADDSIAVPMSAQLKARYEKEAKSRASRMLAVAVERAGKAGLKADGVALVSDVPYKQIVDLARKRKCDLIVMASHGRQGLSALLLGSETVKVLTHSKVPVLVVR